MEIVHTQAAPQAIGPYSQGVIAGQLFFSSGQIALTPAGELVNGDIEAQTEQVLHNIQAVLAAAGLTLEDVVKTTVFLKEIATFPKMNQIYERFFGQHKPARSCVEVARLPRDVLVEIEVIAHIA